MGNMGLGTRHPLSAPIEAGIVNLKRLGLNTEASMLEDISAFSEYSDMLISVHSPVNNGDQRLNYGAVDDEFRDQSVAHIIGYIEAAGRYPNVRQVNMHPPPRQWLAESQLAGRTGDYDRMIDGMRRIAHHAAKLNMEIVLENNNAYWTGVEEAVPAEEVNWTKQNQAFGTAPEEWIQICLDVDRDNVHLCLDSSHACTYAQTFPDVEQRKDVVMRFLAEPALIRHVHWNDNYLYDVRGRNDSHAALGKGSLPVEMHRAIKGLDATLLIEHFYSIEELEGELEFIASL